MGKDIAYQLWKLGLLGMDFFYHPFHRYASGHTAYMTNAEGNREIENPNFGGGSEVYNVIDSRQAYLQNIVIAGLTGFGLPGTGRPLHSLLLRDGGVVAALLRGLGNSAFRRGQAAALR